VHRQLSGFIRAHRGCGYPRAKAEPQIGAGYLLWVDCPCGATFERWVAPQTQDEDLLRSALLALENWSPNSYSPGAQALEGPTIPRLEGTYLLTPPIGGALIRDPAQVPAAWTRSRNPDAPGGGDVK
jgi:hypothetical protein